MEKNVTPLISVIMPVYNSIPFLSEAIESVLHQTFESFELIIINDGSTDESKSILDLYVDSRIFVKSNNHNKGIACSLNYGISIARGQFITRMDADDVMMPKRLEKQFHYLMSHPEVGIVGSRAFCINSEGKIFGHYYVTRTNVLIKSRLFFECSLIHPSIMIRKSILDEYNIGYDVSYAHAQDYRLWVDLSDKTEFYNLPMKLLKYRIHTSAISSKKTKNRNLQFDLALLTLSEMYKKNNVMLTDKEMAMIVASTLGMLCNIEHDYREFPKVARKVVSQVPKQYSKITVFRGFAKLWVSNTRLKIWKQNSIIFNIIGVFEIGLARIRRKYI